MNNLIENISESKKIYIGSKQVKAVYLGTEKIWEVNTKFRYIKLDINKNRGSVNTTQFSEFKFLTDGGTVFDWGDVSIVAPESLKTSESVYNLVDNDISTKYCVQTAIPFSIVFDLGKDNKIDTSVYNQYSYCTGDDVPDRDPISWVLSGSNNGTNWVTLSQVTIANITTSRNTWVDTCYINSSGIPGALQKVDYVESTGTQYIDTGVNFDNNTIISGEFTFLGYTTTSGITAYGLLGVDTYNNFSATMNIAYRTDFNFDLRCHWSNLLSTAATSLQYVKSTFEIKGYNVGSSIKLNDLSTVASGSVSSNRTITIGIINSDKDTGRYGANARFHSIKIIKNETLVKDLVPVYRKSDGKTGFYDNVNGQFLTNLADVEFVIPPVIPSEYRTVKYIQSSGTQYIDTLYAPNGNTTVECVLDMESRTEQIPFGVLRDQTTPHLWYSEFVIGSYLIRNSYGTNENANNIDWRNFANYIITITKTPTGVEYQKMGSRNSRSYSKQTFQFKSDERMMMFAGYRITEGIIRHIYAKMYSFTISENGTVIKKFVPVVRTSDSAVGMYETVNGQFYENLGTGTFTAGPNVE